ncbi:protein of unknown function (plasmid) [Rhodovastum atsumiense]|nr:protein of unknown function [Rhodovastum atsumiense]
MPTARSWSWLCWPTSAYAQSMTAAGPGGVIRERHRRGAQKRAEVNRDPAYQPIDPLGTIDRKEEFRRRSPLRRLVTGLIDVARPVLPSDPPESAIWGGPIG